MKSFKDLTFKEKLEHIGTMAIYPLILLYKQLGKLGECLNAKRKQIAASILTVCLILSMIPLSAMPVAAASAPQVSYSIGKTYSYAVSKKFITNLSYGTSSPSTSNGSASISGNKVTLSTGSSSDKLGKLVYASVAVKVTVPANSAFSIVHKIAASATRVSSGSTKASVFLYDMGQSDKSSSLTFYPYDDDENKNGSDSREMKYTFGGKGTESISLSDSDDAIIYTNETSSAKTFTHYYGVMIAIQYGSTKNNRMQSTFTFSNSVTSITNASNNGVAYMAFDTPWTAKKGTVPAGNYYLTSDFVGTDTYFINDTVNLCLNGKALTWSGVNYARFRVNDGGTFGLYDCGSGGSVTADDGEGAIANYGNGTVNMHGGTLTNIRFPGAAIANLAGGTVNVYGGTAIAEDGSGITVGTGTVNVYGGTINGSSDGIYSGSTGTVNVSGGTVNGSGDNGIDNYSTGKVNISGSAKVTGKNRGIYNYRNGKITVKGGTVTGAKDGIYMTESAGTLNVTGGTITGTEGYGIDGYGTLSILAPAKVVGGTDGICCGSTAPILISATVEVTGDGGYGIYYYGSSTLDFSGTVTVSGTDGYGVFNRNAGTVNITGTVNATENYSCGVSNNGSGTVNILDGATVYSAKNVGVRNQADGTVEMKGGAVTGSSYGIHNYDTGVIKMSGGTVTATTKKGIYNGHRGTLHITGGTVQSVNEYGVSSMGIAYLSNNPTISGALADWYHNSNYSSFYAESNDTTPVPYSGDNLSIYINEAIEGSIVVNNVTDNNKGSFSLTDDVYYLEQSGDDLVLVKVPPHIHTDVEDEFTKLTKTSGSLASGKYYLADNFTATGNLIISAGNTVTLCLNGHTLDFDGIGETVINYGTLYICDCIGDGCLTVSGALENNGTLEFSGGKVYCEDGGTINNSGNLILSGGTVESGGTAYVLSNYTSGTVTLSGADIIGCWGIYNQSTAKNAVTVTSGNIAATDDFGIYNYADGNITISGGTIISQSDAAIYNGKAGTVTVTGGKVSGKYGIYNKAGGTANISGGTVSGTNYGVLNYDDGAVKVSGGTVEATGTGNYIYGIDNSSNGTLTVSAGKISGTTYGIHTYGNTYITGGTVTGKNIAGIIVKSTITGGTATHVSGGTVSGADNGVVLSGGSVYLSDKPTVTGDVADLHIVIGAGSNIYAQSSDASASYSGDPITVNAYNGKAGATVIRNVTDGNKEKFSVTNAGYKLKLGTGDNADNLVLAQAHTHQGVSGEFDELTDWSQLTTSGKYYISDNTPSVSRGYTIPSGAEVTLCLNGKTVDFDSVYFTVSGTFKICDCKNTGAIIGDPGYALVRNYGNFYIDSGSISNTAGYAISNSNSAANTTVTGTAKVSAKTSSTTACAIKGYGNITISGNATVSAECTVESYFTDCISLYSSAKSLRISGNAKLISKAVTFATGVSTESSSTKVYISDNVSISVSTTTSGRNVYALDGPSTLYLSGNPTFSLNGGTSSAVLHPSSSSKIYVHSEDTTPVPYTGDPLTAYFYNHKSGDVAIYDTTDINILKSVNPVYSIVVGTGENANNLLVKKAHTHDGVEGEFADWTAKSGTVSTSGTYYLFQDITATGNITIAKDTEATLCLNGHTLDLGSNYIINEGTLTICDCQATAGKITGTNAYSIKNKSELTVISGTVSGYRGISNSSTGTVEISGTAKIIGSGDGIFNDGTVSISGNATVSGTSEYGIQNYGTIYLSGSPVISGYASIYVLDGKIYAQSSDGSAAYIGGEMTVRLYSSDEGDVIVYNVDNGNKDLFKLKDSEYLLIQSGENLVLAVPHTHSWSDKWTSDGTAHWHECTASGCTVAENSQKDGYAAHTPKADDGDCTTAIHCAVCDKETTPANAVHSFTTKASATLATKATCQQAATYYVQCDHCDKVSSTVTVAVGGVGDHSFTGKASSVLAWGATCQQAAAYYMQCDHCDEVSDTKTVTDGVLGSHSFTTKASATLATKATCQQAATYYVQCDHCDEVSDTEAVAVGGVGDHSFTGKASSVLAWGATCQQAAAYYMQCDHCDEVSDTKTVTDGVLGSHSFTTKASATLATKATCQQAATYYVQCDHCDEVSDTEAVAVGGVGDHTWDSAWSKDKDNHWHKCLIAGCTEIKDNAKHFSDKEENKATYLKKAVCDDCGIEYGEKRKDTIAPTGKISIGTNDWNSVLNTITFGYFFKATQTVTITAVDAETGVAETAYYLATEKMDKSELDGLDNGAWVVEDEFSLNPENKYIVYARITDKAGNVAYLSTDGLVFFEDTAVTEGEYDYTLTSKTDIVTNIKPGNNTVEYIDICEPGDGAGNALEYSINLDGYLVLKGDSIEGFAKDWYAGDYTVTVFYNALGEVYVEGVSQGDKITETVLTLHVSRCKVTKPTADPTVFTYTGAEQTYTIPVSALYAVTNNTRTAAGEQDVTVALVDDRTYEWADGTTDALTFRFVIEKASFTARVSQYGTLTYSGFGQFAMTSTLADTKGGQTATFRYGLTPDTCNDINVPPFKNVDTYTVYFVASAPNHHDVTGSFEVKVGKKALTVTAKDNTITYGDEPTANGVVYDGFVDGEGTSVLGGTLGYAFDYTRYGDVGNGYAITPQGLTAQNYSITFAPGRLTVNPLEAEITWSALDAAALVYDGEVNTLTATVENAQNGDEVMFAIDLTGDNVNVTADGFYYTVTGLTGDKAGNYTLGAALDSPTYAVTKKALTVTAKDNTITYGDEPTANGVVYDGFVDGEGTSVLGGTLGYAFDYTRYGDVGNGYTITPQGLTAQNYSITFAPGRLTVNPLEAEITWSALDAAALVYDGEANTLTATVENAQNGDEVTFAIDLTGDNVNVTADGFYYTVTGLTGDKAGNYTLGAALDSPTYAVTKKALTVTAKDNTITYGDEPTANGVVYDGFVDGEGTSVLGGTLGYAFDYTRYGDVGNGYTITPQGLTAQNYSITFAPGRLTVNPLEAEITWSVLDAAALVYDGEANTLTATVENAQNGDEVMFAIDLTGDNVNVTADGFYYTVTGLTGDKAGNYTLGAALDSPTYAVTKKALTVTAKDNTITYGDEPTANGVVYDGFVDGEGTSVLGGTLGYAFDYTRYGDVGNGYAITPQGLTAQNYSITFAPGRLTVVQKEIGIDWFAPTSLVYDGTAKVPTAVVTGLVNEDSVNITVQLADGDNVNVGSFTYKAIGIDNTNYTLPNEVTSDSYAVTARPLIKDDFHAVIDGFVYTGEALEPPVSSVQDLVTADDYTVVYENNILAGTDTAKIILTGKNNACGTVEILFSIAKATPSVACPDGLVGNAGDKLSSVILGEGFAWDEAQTVIAYSSNLYAMTYTPADTANYNTLKKAVAVNGLDVTAPTGEIRLEEMAWNSFMGGVQFGLFYKDAQSISITAGDTESLVKEIAYYLAAEELTAEDVKALDNSRWTVYTEAFAIEPDKKLVVYARITDNAGNVTYINSNGIVLDKTSPIIAGVEDGKDIYGNTTFTVDETYLDSVTLDGAPIEVKDGKYTIPADNKAHTIVVTDKTGNKVTYTLSAFMLYDVRFVVDGVEIAAHEVGYGKDASLPEIPAKEGYTAKWDVDGKNITADTVITAVYETIPQEPQLPQSPQTGDNTNLWLWVALLFVSGVSVFGAGFAKKREEDGK